MGQLRRDTIGGLASGMSADGSGYIAGIAYVPFINSGAPIWPWANARIGLRSTYYDDFDRTTMGAHDDDSLFLYAWLAI